MERHVSWVPSSLFVGLTGERLVKSHVLSPGASFAYPPLPVHQQCLFGSLKSFNHGFKVVAKVCPDIKLFPVSKLTPQRFQNFAAMQLPRQTNCLCYVLARVAEVVEVPTQIRNLNWYSKWIAAIRLLCHEALKIVILAKSDHPMGASRVFKPQANWLTKLLLHPNRASSPFFLKAPPFGAGKNERNNHGGNRADCAYSVPVHSICILERSTLHIPSRAPATLLHGAFQHPCRIVHPSIPLWIGRHFAMGAQRAAA